MKKGQQERKESDNSINKYKMYIKYVYIYIYNAHFTQTHTMSEMKNDRKTNVFGYVPNVQCMSLCMCVIYRKIWSYICVFFSLRVEKNAVRRHTRKEYIQRGKKYWIFDLWCCAQCFMHHSWMKTEKQQQQRLRNWWR